MTQVRSWGPTNMRRHSPGWSGARDLCTPALKHHMWKHKSMQQARRMPVLLGTFCYIRIMHRSWTYRGNAVHTRQEGISGSGYRVYVLLLISLALQPSAGYDLVHEVFVITHNDAPQSVGLLWTSDQLVAETSTWQHTQQTHIQAPGGIRTHALDRAATGTGRIHVQLYFWALDEGEWSTSPWGHSNLGKRDQCPLNSLGGLDGR
jgi:hypothetical protein